MYMYIYVFIYTYTENPTSSFGDDLVGKRERPHCGSEVLGPGFDRAMPSSL